MSVAMEPWPAALLTHTSIVGRGSSWTETGWNMISNVVFCRSAAAAVRAARLCARMGAAVPVLAAT